MTDRQIGILGLGAYVPERVMTNADWEKYVDTTDEWITSRTGIKERRIAAEDQSTVHLAAAAAERALQDAGLTIDAIDEIIVATDTREVAIPDTASFLQQKLGAREIPAFDMAGSGCAGFIFGLDVARSRALQSNRKSSAGGSRAADPPDRLERPQHLRPVRRRCGSGRHRAR